MTEERKGTLAVLAAAVGYGFLAVLTKLALEAGAGVVPLAAWRFLSASAIVWILLALRRRPPPPLEAWPSLAGLGAIYAINALAFIAALQWVPAATAVLVFYTYPVVVVLLASLFLGERFTRHRAGGMTLAVLGCALTAGVGARGGHPLGIGLVLLSMASLSVYIVASRRTLAPLPGQGSAAVMISATAVVFAIVALATGSFALGGGARAAWLVGLLSLASTALPITLFVVGLKRIGAGRAAIFSTIEPVVTVCAAAALLGERIGPAQLVGGALILGGVLWLRLERPFPASEAPSALDAP